MGLLYQQNHLLLTMFRAWIQFRDFLNIYLNMYEEMFTNLVDQDLDWLL